MLPTMRMGLKNISRGQIRKFGSVMTNRNMFVHRLPIISQVRTFGTVGKMPLKNNDVNANSESKIENDNKKDFRTNITNKVTDPRFDQYEFTKKEKIFIALTAPITIPIALAIFLFSVLYLFGATIYILGLMCSTINYFKTGEWHKCNII